MALNHPWSALEASTDTSISVEKRPPARSVRSTVDSASASDRGVDWDLFRSCPNRGSFHRARELQPHSGAVSRSVWPSRL